MHVHMAILKLLKFFSNVVQTPIHVICGNLPHYTRVSFYNNNRKIQESNLSDRNLVRNPYGAVRRRRPSKIRTPLYPTPRLIIFLAAQKGRVEVCNLLLAYGADPHITNCHGKSSIELASKELSERLLRNYRGLKLIEACAAADTVKMKKYLSSDTINFASLLNGETPLHAAVNSPFAKRRVLVELLLRKGAGVQLLSHDASSPMHLAAHAGHVESCELLLKHGAQLNIQDNKGDTPLHKAASNGHLALCQKLISRGKKSIKGTISSSKINFCIWNHKMM